MTLDDWIVGELKGKDSFAITQQKFCQIFEIDKEAEDYLKLHLPKPDERDYYFTLSSCSLGGMPELIFKRK